MTQNNWILTEKVFIFGSIGKVLSLAKKMTKTELKI